MKPLVSILIPAYNSGKWLKDTVKSALGQTWMNKEVIIVNDGSTDDTLQIAKSFESGVVKVISQPNSGACVARNKALECAQGDYIQWLDADDLLHAEKLTAQLKAAEGESDSRVLLTSSFGTFFFQAQRATFRPSSLWHDLTPVDWMVRKFSEGVWLNPATWLVSRKLTELAGSWDEKLTWNDDGEYICRIVSTSKKVKFVSNAICYYRIGNMDSLGSELNRSRNRLCSQLLSIAAQNRYLLNLEDSEITRASCIKHLQDNYLYIYPEHVELVEMANDLAKEFGGRLVPPTLKRRYRIIRKVFGWEIAKHALFMLPKVKILGKKYYDKYTSTG